VDELKKDAKEKKIKGVTKERQTPGLTENESRSDEGRKK
jgi:hypothetical protein